MHKCFFCAKAIGLLEEYYPVQWHPLKGTRWKCIGAACTDCGETRMTRIESIIKPEAAL